jgi:hypothetical protein
MDAVSDGQTTYTETTVTDNNTGQSVTTQEDSTAFTDAQGNTVTAEGQSVSTSEGE